MIMKRNSLTLFTAIVETNKGNLMFFTGLTFFTLHRHLAIPKRYVIVKKRKIYPIAIFNQ